MIIKRVISVLVGRANRGGDCRKLGRELAAKIAILPDPRETAAELIAEAERIENRKSAVLSPCDGVILTARDALDRRGFLKALGVIAGGAAADVSPVVSTVARICFPSGIPEFSREKLVEKVFAGSFGMWFDYYQKMAAYTAASDVNQPLAGPAAGFVRRLAAERGAVFRLIAADPALVAGMPDAAIGQAAVRYWKGMSEPLGGLNHRVLCGVVNPFEMDFDWSDLFSPPREEAIARRFSISGQYCLTGINRIMAEGINWPAGDFPSAWKR